MVVGVGSALKLSLRVDQFDSSYFEAKTIYIVLPEAQAMSQLNDKIVDACSREKAVATLFLP